MSKRILTSKYIKLASTIIAISGLTSCSQMTKHSNTLVFGTNTSIGIKVGQSANQTPTIEIGYNRQEAAFVPLLANTGISENGELKPCPSKTVTTNGNVTIDIKNCLFIATHDGQDKDSYSTIASFGAKIGATATSGDVTLAQYFATGIAAQYLTLTGGANIVQAGGDTQAKAEAAGALAAAELARIHTSAATIVRKADEAAEAIQVAIDKNSDGIVDTSELTALKAHLPRALVQHVDQFDGKQMNQLVTFLKQQIPIDLPGIAESL